MSCMGNLKELNSKKSKQEETLLTDQDLWQKIRTGDRKAFASLFKNYYQQLYRFTGRIVRDTQAAENIVQDLFVTIWTKRESLFIKSSLKSYLYTAVKNRGFSYRSRQVPDELTTDQATASPEEDYLKKELHTAVHLSLIHI